LNIHAAADIPTSPADYSAIAPELAMLGTGLVLLLMIALKRFKNDSWYAAIAAFGTLFSAGWAIALWNAVESGEVGDDHVRFAFSGMVVADGFGAFLSVLICLAVLLGILLSDVYLRHENAGKAEYYILLLFSAAGMQFMVISNNLVMMFISLELLSVCLYILSAWHRDRSDSQEAGLKYLLLGAFSSAFLLYGIAFLYGATGTTNLVGFEQYFAENVLFSSGMVLLGMVLVVVGLCFKVAAVPFHMWAPDVYQGAPMPVVAFMAAGAKVAGFAGLWRVLEVGLSAYELDWQPLLWAIAAITMLVGSVLAIVQTDVKRMMAYSSIAHAGFILTGLVAANEEGVRGALFYLVAYTIMVMGAFAVISLVARRGEQDTSLEDYRGLSRREPLLAGILAFLLFAMAGIPGTSGFVAKFAVFGGLAGAERWVLIVVGTLASVLSAFFYLRLVVYMFMEGLPLEGKTPTLSRLPVPGVSAVVLAVTVFFTLQLGVLPEGLLDIAGRATLFAG